MKATSRKQRRRIRHERVRRRVFGTGDRPRMNINISNRNGEVQFIDDDKGITVAGVGTVGNTDGRLNMSAAYELGKAGAEKANACGVEEVVIDRAGRKFHGRVKEIVRGALENGLKAGKSETPAAVEGGNDKEEQ